MAGPQEIDYAAGSTPLRRPKSKYKPFVILKAVVYGLIALMCFMGVGVLAFSFHDFEYAGFSLLIAVLCTHRAFAAAKRVRR